VLLVSSFPPGFAVGKHRHSSVLTVDGVIGSSCCLRHEFVHVPEPSWSLLRHA
jgi:hypothetical protein